MFDSRSGVVTVVTGVCGLGQELAGRRHPLEGRRADACTAPSLPRAPTTRSRGSNGSTKSSASTRRRWAARPTRPRRPTPGAFDLIRELFAKLPEAKVRGYTARRFSFNQAGGRCEACEGAGQKRIEMHFLPDVWITCDACGGTRFTPETLAVKFHGKTIADVLDMSVDAALELFANVPKIRKILQTLHDVGLGYSRSARPRPTLSGGEAQRVKLAAELARPDTGKTLYILDEPTTGLHFDDIRKLLDVIHRLADLGNTVVVIEHNLEVIKTADWVIDLGPEAGLGGGDLVAEGTPEAIVERRASHTAAIPRRPCSPPARWAERPRFDPKSRKKSPATRHRTAQIRRLHRANEEGPNRQRAPAQRRAHTSGSPGPLGNRRPEMAYPRPGRRQRPPGAVGRANPRADRRPHRGDRAARSSRPDRVVPARRRADQDQGRRRSRLPVLPRDDLGGMGRYPSVLRPPKNTFRAVRSRISSLCPVPPERDARAQRPAAAEGHRPRPGFQEITIVGHSAADFDTPGFEAFLKKAIASFLGIGTPAGSGRRAS